MRGMGEQKAAGLKINRELWLDENGRELTFRDRITGAMQKIWRLDAAAGEAIGLHATLEEAEAPLAARDDLQHAELRHVPLDDAGEGADLGRDGGRTHLAAFADEADAEGRVVLEARGRHSQVALLEEA